MGTTDTGTLAAAIDGMVLLPGQESYAEARLVWNAMVDRRPEIIVQCASTADVAAGILFARRHDLEIGVKCGGHSVVGQAVPDGGLMLDLTRLDEVVVDPAQGRARIGGGALLSVLDRATQAHGLGVTAGNISHTGVGGLTLGGGMGWLARQLGLTCDNVESFRMVTASGETVTASADENPDLFWGLRGGGGNFGVVTEFEFRLHPVAGTAAIADHWFDLDAAVPAMAAWRDLIEAAPREASLTAWAGMVDGRPRANLGFVWVGDPAGAQALHRDFAALGTAADAQLRELSYLELQTMDDSLKGHARRRYWKGHYLRELPEAAIEAFLLRGTSDGSGELVSNASLVTHGGAISEVADDATAFSHRDTLVEFNASAAWDDPGEDDQRIGAARRYGATIEPYASGAYVNALADEGAAGVRSAYPGHKLARLTELKDAWDPDNVFHLNHNVPPSRSRLE